MNSRKTVSVTEAKARFTELIRNAETVTITVRGKPVATLLPIRRDSAEVVAGIRRLRGAITASSEEIVQIVREGRRY